MRRTFLVAVLALLAVVAGWWLYQRFTAPAATPAAEAPLDTEAAAEDTVIWASGRLTPVRWASLSPAAGGKVARVQVEAGDQVEEGALLVELADELAQSQVETAQAALAEAEAAREKLLEGATEAELAAAQADVAAAEAGVALAQAGVQQANESVAAAQAQLAIAQAQYNELASHPTPAERIAAQKQIDLAAATLQQAQSAYDAIRGDPHAGAMPQAAALQQATIAFEAATAASEAILQGATPQQRAVARAQIAAAQHQVAMAQARLPEAQAGVSSAQAQMARAQAGLKARQDGATAADKAMADARVRQAQAALGAAQAQLQQMQIVAPFAGQVGSVMARPGEMAVPGSPLILLGDTSQMQVETTDLRETDVAHVQEGMRVEVSFDALPGRTFEGTILRIAPISTTEKGSTDFTLTVAVTDLDPALRWGMTALVNIEPER